MNIKYTHDELVEIVRQLTRDLSRTKKDLQDLTDAQQTHLGLDFGRTTIGAPHPTQRISSATFGSSGDIIINVDGISIESATNISGTEQVRKIQWTYNDGTDVSAEIYGAHDEALVSNYLLNRVYIDGTTEDGSHIIGIWNNATSNYDIYMQMYSPISGDTYKWNFVNEGKAVLRLYDGGTDDTHFKIGHDSDGSNAYNVYFNLDHLEVGGSLPTASATYRGFMIYEPGASGVTDKLWTCIKTAADTYKWINSATRTISISYVIDGGGATITTGVKGFLEIPFDMTITGWTILGDQSGSIVIDVWKDTYANYPPTVADTIAGTEKPTISTSTKGQDLSLSTWTTVVTAGDILGFNVDSVTSIQRCTLAIKGIIT